MQQEEPSDPTARANWLPTLNADMGTEVLPSGKTEKGASGLTGTTTVAESRAGTSLSFALPLPPGAAFVLTVGAGESAGPECPGSVGEPEAAAGLVLSLRRENRQRRPGLRPRVELLQHRRSVRRDAKRPGVRFLALSVSDSPEDVLATIRAGARGHVAKSITPEELVQAIHRVADGDAVFSPWLAGFVLDAFSGRSDSAESPTRIDPELDSLTPPRARGPAADRPWLHLQGDRRATAPVDPGDRNPVGPLTDALSHSSPTWLVASLVLMCLSIVVRSVAWRAILRGALPSSRVRLRIGGRWGDVLPIVAGTIVSLPLTK